MKIKIKRKKKDRKASNRKTKVIIGLPSDIEIELVQANELKLYELFQWLVVILLPVAVGFWTAYLTVDKAANLFWSALAFSGLSALFVILAFLRRKKVFRGSVKKTAYLDSFRGRN